MERTGTDAPTVVPDPITLGDVARRIVRRADAISPSPSLLRIEGHLRRGDTSARQLGRLIEGSPALAARVLRLANSAFYAPSEPVVSLSRAVVLMGDMVLRQIVLTSLITSRRATARTPRQLLAAARLMGDAVRSAVVCRVLAGATRLAAPDDAFAAGLLHDLGHIYLLDDDDDRYASYLLEASGHTDGLEQEIALSGTTHAHVGAAFADAWHLPATVSDVLQEHHNPQPRTLSAIVAASDWLVRELNSTSFKDPTTFSDRVDIGLASIGLTRAAWEARVPAVREEYADLLTMFDTGAG
jgi:HD-like signal output (HDOD) protein